jgi:hypothetical protein
MINKPEKRSRLEPSFLEKENIMANNILIVKG